MGIGRTFLLFAKGAAFKTADLIIGQLETVTEIFGFGFLFDDDLELALVDDDGVLYIADDDSTYPVPTMSFTDDDPATFLTDEDETTFLGDDV